MLQMWKSTLIKDLQSIPDIWSTSGPAQNGPYSRNDQCVVMEMTIFPKNLPTNIGATLLLVFGQEL